jgi:hypothetical protein
VGGKAFKLSIGEIGKSKIKNIKMMVIILNNTSKTAFVV